MGEINTSWLAPEVVRQELMEVARSTALAEMASGLAHEVNQPLGAIATFSQAGNRMLGRSQPMVADAVEVFQQINQEALGAGEIIKRIRRLFAQKAYVSERCQMFDLVAELRPNLDALVAPINGSVRFHAAADLPDVQVDRLHVQHVLLALVQNAVEASAGISSAKLVRIDVSADRYIVETGVSDSGAGVPAELRSRLFHPFFTTKPQGNGLGLASSRTIIEAHQGTIGFDTHVAGGSRVWFRLPMSTD